MQRGLRMRCGGLGDGRNPGELRMHTRSVPGDHDGVQGQVDGQWDVELADRRLRPRQTAVAAREGAQVVVGPDVGVGDERFAQRDVELHRSGIAGTGAAGGGEHATDRRAPLAVGVEVLLGQSEADGRPHLGAEDAELFDGLIGTRSEQLIGPVGADHHQRYPRIVGLEDGRTHVGDGGTAGHHDRHRLSRRHGQAERQVAGRSFVDAHVQP